MSKAHKGSGLLIRDQMIPVQLRTFHLNCNLDANAMYAGSLADPDKALYSLRIGEGLLGGNAIAVDDSSTNDLNRYEKRNSNSVENATPPTLSPYPNEMVVHVLAGDWSGIYLYPMNTTFDIGEVFSVSAYVYIKRSIKAWFNLQMDSTEFNNKGQGTISVDAKIPGWYRISWENKSRIEQNTNCKFRIEGRYTGDSGEKLDWASDNEYWITAPQIERKPFSTSFVKGTRDAGVIQYSPKYFNVHEGTIALWVKRNSVAPYPCHYIYFGNSDGFTGANFELHLSLSGSENLIAYYVSQDSSQAVNGPAIPVGEYCFIAMTFKEGEFISIYYNGELQASQSLSHISSPVLTGSESLYIGSCAVNDFRVANALLSDIRIDPVAVSDDEIKAWYESQAPFYNPYDYRAYVY
ncbi:LamG domain-containing protein [Chengkuizengella axinellae]|uniref:LamG domain-containing protein n=1 Tax=Chengkuizengella axinellae TaxID=3064388 RepID=A0ABT9IWJ3_9BACL|nr:LamG domain-containing protein [Chengkuizengella sp. 2205SS18-9]MDP5273687.1 LamG domain-containing protein [Chengkuizengella sp. 2205SS18-9]